MDYVIYVLFRILISLFLFIGILSLIGFGIFALVTVWESDFVYDIKQKFKKK